MDGSTVEHSDSDSGESWTLLENTPTHGHEAPDFSEDIPIERMTVELHSEKDDDTDGISIISDSDHESASCEINYVQLPSDEIHLAEKHSFQRLETPSPTNINQNNEFETDYLGDNTKFKTYVHRRNPRIGTILDIIMLGTFIITAGMALGHLWSCKNECNNQTSVNKILSNLYKLQEENAHLRNKLKEITLATGYQPAQPKLEATIYPPAQRKSDKPVMKQPRCKKIFEEPIIKNNKPEDGIKCVNDNKPVFNPEVSGTPEYEKEFLNDIDKMKKIYELNKHWLDEETKKQLNEFLKPNAFDAIKSEPTKENLDKHLGPVQIKPDTQDSETRPTEVVKSHRQVNFEKQIGPTYFDIPPKSEVDTKEDNIKSQKQIKLEKQKGPIYFDIAPKREDEIHSNGQINQEQQVAPNQQPNPPNLEEIHNDNFETVPIKITYADSLKNNQPLLRRQRSVDIDKPSIWTKDYAGKKKHYNDNKLLNRIPSSISEDDIKKDDRYTGPKIKLEKKKNDRQKSHKKQKRNNKYEQWEMKGGYLKDYDELSLASLQDNDKNLVINPDKRFKSQDFENYVLKLMDTEIGENNASNKDQPKKDNKSGEKPRKVDKHASKGDKPWKKGKAKDWQWYDQRSALRAEARLKLEHELFGDNISNNAAWYFRRMQKREQCRAQKDNGTYKKISKQKMNFKMKR